MMIDTCWCEDCPCDKVFFNENPDDFPLCPDCALGNHDA